MPTSARIVVADSGPLIALGRLDALRLLPALFSEIQVTATVLAECAARPELVDTQRIRQAVQVGWLKPCKDHLEGPGGRLDPGEASAIARALEIDAGLLLDDRAAVVYARALGLKVLGTMGLLVLAKRRGHIERVSPLIIDCRPGAIISGQTSYRRPCVPQMRMKASAMLPPLKCRDTFRATAFGNCNTEPASPEPPPHPRPAAAAPAFRVGCGRRDFRGDFRFAGRRVLRRCGGDGAGDLKPARGNDIPTNLLLF